MVEGSWGAAVGLGGEGSPDTLREVTQAKGRLSLQDERANGQGVLRYRWWLNTARAGSERAGWQQRKWVESRTIRHLTSFSG